MSLGGVPPTSFVFLPLPRKSSYGDLYPSQLEKRIIPGKVKVPKQTYRIATIRFGPGVCSPVACGFLNVISH